jgi:predicted nucleic acid-binding Zn ribbon protein
VARSRYEDADDESNWDEPDWDDDSAEDYDPDNPETYPAGVYADPEPATVACPQCGAEVLEDSEQCPRCLQYLSREDAPTPVRSIGWLVMVILMFLAVLMWIVGGL